MSSFLEKIMEKLLWPKIYIYKNKFHDIYSFIFSANFIKGTCRIIEPFSILPNLVMLKIMWVKRVHIRGGGCFFEKHEILKDVG